MKIWGPVELKSWVGILMKIRCWRREPRIAPLRSHGTPPRQAGTGGMTRGGSELFFLIGE